MSNEKSGYTILAGVLMFLGCITIIYLFLSFIVWDSNFLNWGWFARFILVFAIIGAFVGIIIPTVEQVVENNAKLREKKYASNSFYNKVEKTKEDIHREEIKRLARYIEEYRDTEGYTPEEDQGRHELLYNDIRTIISKLGCDIPYSKGGTTRV